MGQVIQNIVLNASDAMPGGGTVKISAVNMGIPAGEKPSMPEGGKFVSIVIEDTGIGIPEKYLTQIFDPYFSTKQKGSGLGLATSYSIIRNQWWSDRRCIRTGPGHYFFHLRACLLSRIGACSARGLRGTARRKDPSYG
ncbi:MAG: ATP-binding protein [Acidobacteriota bacterium]